MSAVERYLVPSKADAIWNLGKDRVFQLTHMSLSLCLHLSDSNSNGSYYYKNDSGSTYYNSGSGYSRYSSGGSGKGGK